MSSDTTVNNKQVTGHAAMPLTPKVGALGTKCACCPQLRLGGAIGFVAGCLFRLLCRDVVSLKLCFHRCSIFFILPCFPILFFPKFSSNIFFFLSSFFLASWLEFWLARAPLWYALRLTLRIRRKDLTVFAMYDSVSVWLYN